MNYGLIAPHEARENEAFPVVVTSCNNFKDVQSVDINGTQVYLADDYGCETIKHDCFCWEFGTSGEQTLTVTITNKDTSQEVLSTTVTVMTDEEDRLLTNNQELLSIDSSILSHLPCGRLDWLYKIRHATKDILLDLQEQRWFRSCECNKKSCNTCCDYINNEDFQVVASDLYDLNDIRIWANYYTLYLIYNDLWDSVDDVNYRKSLDYYNMALKARDRSIVRINNQEQALMPKNKRSITLRRGL